MPSLLDIIKKPLGLFMGGASFALSVALVQKTFTQQAFDEFVYGNTPVTNNNVCPSANVGAADPLTQLDWVQAVAHGVAYHTVYPAAYTTGVYLANKCVDSFLLAFEQQRKQRLIEAEPVENNEVLVADDGIALANALPDAPVADRARSTSPTSYATHRAPVAL